MASVQEPDHLRHNDRTLVHAWHDGDLMAAGQLIDRHQHELLRAAFLFCDDNQAAVDLVATSTVEILRELRQDLHTDAHTTLISGLARRYLSTSTTHSAARWRHNARITPSGRFIVENERTRMRAALKTLEPAGRVAIILTDLAHLPDAVAAEATGLSVLDIEAARERLRFVAGLDEGVSLNQALAFAALDAPRVNLWELIEAELGEWRRARRQRARLINVGAVTVTVLAIAGLFWVLLDLGGPTGGNIIDGSENLVRPPSARVSAGNAVQQIIPTPPPPPMPTAVPTPPADVPNVMLVRSETPDGQMTLLRRFSAGAQQVLSISSAGEFREAASPIVAPDGEQVIMLWHHFINGEMRAVVTAYDGDLQRMEWSARIMTYPFEGSATSRPPVFLHGAVDDERIYVAVHPWESSDPVEIFTLRREDGLIETRIPTNVSGFSAHSLRVVASPGHDTAYLYAISQDQPSQFGDLHMIYLAYHVPDGERVHSRTLADKPDSRAFFLYESRLTPDGNYLYGVTYTDANQELAVHFLHLAEGRLQPRLLLPFEPVADPLPYQYASSHDGRWLYVLSPASRQIAVVDLERRALAGLVPLNMGPDFAGAVVEADYVRDRRMQISPDGRTLYALGTGLHSGAPGAGIWVIDVPTWTLNEVWLPGMTVSRLIAAGGHSLYASLPPGTSLTYADQPASGVQIVPFETLSATTPDSLETLATLYRHFYGRSPSVEGHVPGITADFYPLAGMDVAISDHRLMLDERVEVDVRFINPLTNVPVYEGSDDANTRYTPPDGVRAVLTNGGETVLLELGRAAHGWYRGSVILPAPGAWNLTVVARWSGEAADERRHTHLKPIRVEGLTGATSGNALGIPTHTSTRTIRIAGGQR